MRVITGTAKGRKLKTPPDYDVRPTTDNVKECLFNIINFDIEGRRVLDLFAGTGQLGIEALSRGAAEAVFVDCSSNALKIVKENLKLCGFSAPVILSDAVSFLKGASKFDIIFIDPPYDGGLYEPALEAICEFDLLNDNGIIIVESRNDYSVPALKQPYVLKKEYKYGHIKLSKIIKEC